MYQIVTNMNMERFVKEGNSCNLRSYRYDRSMLCLTFAAENDKCYFSSAISIQARFQSSFGGYKVYE